MDIMSKYIPPSDNKEFLDHEKVKTEGILNTDASKSNFNSQPVKITFQKILLTKVYKRLFRKKSNKN